MSETIKPLTEKEGESKDLLAENVEKLKQLFPEIVSDGKVDFETLQEVLGDFKEESKERYSFTWNGKSKARKLAMTPSRGTLRPAPEESVNWHTTENLFIEGDNLEVLKLLQRSYHRKVKMIYIDPPYNTGNDFVYKDDYKDNIGNYLKLTGQLDEEGKKITTNPEYSGRFHTDWLNMIYPRLMLAKELLREDGVIFISIDENELANLLKICNEVFGEDNYRNTFIARRHDKNLNRQFIETGLKSYNVGFEYIVAYARSDDFNFNGVYKEASKERQNNGYWKGFWNSPDRPTMRYDILGFEPSKGQWKWKEETARKAIENYKVFKEEWSDKLSLEEYWEKTGKKKKFIRRNLDGKGKNKGVENWIPPSEGILRNTNLLDILATKKEIVIGDLFDYPKNIDLLKLMCEMAMEDGDIALDFFAGSASLGHSMIDLNNEKNINLSFILVQIPEPVDDDSDAFEKGFKNLADIAKERIRLVTDNYSNEDPTNNEGFKVFKLDKTNLKLWDPNFDEVQLSIEESIENIKPNRSEQDVLYEILLKYGLDLTLPIEIREIAETKVFVAGAGALFICLAPKIDLEVVKGIVLIKEDMKPEITRVVFRDSGFKDDLVKTNTIQILKQHGIKDVKSI